MGVVSIKCVNHLHARTSTCALYGGGEDIGMRLHNCARSMLHVNNRKLCSLNMPCDISVDVSSNLALQIENCSVHTHAGYTDN